MLEPGIPRGAGPCPLAPDHCDRASFITLCQIKAAVGRAIVHDDDLQVRPALAETGLDGFAEPRSTVAAWDDDADPGRHRDHGARSRSRAQAFSSRNGPSPVKGRPVTSNK